MRDIEHAGLKNETYDFEDVVTRAALPETLPLDISLLVTFEMFDNLDLGSSTGRANDYSVAHVGPGEYFVCEAEVAKRRGLRWKLKQMEYMPDLELAAYRRK